MAIFQGAATALVTPFIKKYDCIDFDSLGHLVDMQLAGGINALVVNGTTGEPNTTTHKERKDVEKFCIERVAKRIPVILGTGSNNTYTAVEYTREAQDLGADAVLVVTPYYNKSTQKGLAAHFKAVGECSNLPVIMYNVPSRTGINLLPDTVASLVGSKNIVAVKEASGNVNQMMEITRLTAGRLDMYSGDDGLVVPCMAVGGKGVISVASNVCPEYMVQLTQAMFDKEFDKALEMQLHLHDLVKALFIETNPIPVKTALHLMGLCSAYMRMPLVPMENVALLKKAMTQFGIKLKKSS